MECVEYGSNEILPEPTDQLHQLHQLHQQLLVLKRSPRLCGPEHLLPKRSILRLQALTL